MLEWLLLLIIFGVGYYAGERNGWKHGFAEAEAMLPLRLRQESYELGQCILCQTKPDEQVRSDCNLERFIST